MPRPGPRPYECVRRAWHSDRHQPIRGSIIQQIFRVANDAHSAATKKNKEWQEKLPIVVLKAEEIMYSKANYESEYIDPETLWDRLNDAVNTIIRRDESSESGAGELLPPCIEAALNLGCIPVRASRSQRHTNPRSYLSPRVQEPVSVPLRLSEKTNEIQCSQSSQFQSSSQLNFARTNTTVSSTVPVSEYNRHLTEATKVASPCYYPSLNENMPPGFSTLLTKETNKELQLGSTYPLYYGKDYHIKRPHFASHVPEKTCNNILVGKPISKSVAEATEMGAMQNFFFCPSAEIAGRRFSQADLGNTQEKPPGTQYDLSLRLGPSTDPCMSMERSSAQMTEDLASSSSQDRGKYTHLSRRRNMELFLSPSRNTNDPFDSFPTKCFYEGEGHNLDTTIRKRKAPFNDNVEDGQFCWQPEIPSNQFIGRIERRGL
ncbi:uncharacterized protein [Euphorbia lathyris]|uniref:uncharacterized protein n=1 Tax=Euphorbia lathyris TaxID=212925 RepID=UPI0033133F3E